VCPQEDEESITHGAGPNRYGETMKQMITWMLLLLSGVAGATPDPPAVTGLPDFADLVDALVPTTVHIQVQRGPAVAPGLQQLRRDYQLPGSASSGPPTHGQITSGSGVIVDSRGVVLTNHHVVDAAHTIQITLVDKRVFAAEVVGSDPRTDVAVLRVQTEDPLPAATLGDSSQLRVGQWVLAVGNPFDFPFSVTAGIVSGRGRRGLNQDKILDYIQTDASVNLGSSGGPLFNLRGEVVGINTAIFSLNEERPQNAGISFAIPIDMAARIAKELLKTGRVAYSSIGAATRDSPTGPDDPRPGAEVVQIAPKGPAERGGLRRGDVIIAINSQPVGSQVDLQGMVLATGVGTPLTVRFERGEATREIKIKTVDEHDLGEWEHHDDATQWGGAKLVLADPERLSGQGIALPEHKSPGLLVVAVVPDSPADTAGLAPGDVLLEIQRKPIKSVDHLLGTVRGRNTAVVGFWRGTTMQLAVVGGLNTP